MIIGGQFASIPMRISTPPTARCKSEDSGGCPVICCQHEGSNGDGDITPENFKSHLDRCSSNFTEIEEYRSQLKENPVLITDGSKNLCDCKGRGEMDDDYEDDHDHDHDHRRRLAMENDPTAAAAPSKRVLKKRRNKGSKGSKKDDLCSGHVYMTGDVETTKGTQWLIPVSILLIILSFVGPLAFIFWLASRTKRRIELFFEPWKAKNIQFTYIRPTKHTPAYLCFTFSGQQQFVQVVNQGDVRVVQQPGMQQHQHVYGIQQGTLIQQPTMAQGKAVQPMQMQQGQVQGQVVQPMQIQQGQIAQPIQQQRFQPAVVTTTVPKI